MATRRPSKDDVDPLDAQKPVVCWFFRMQPSEYEELSLDDLARFLDLLNDYVKANAPKKGR